MSNVFNCLVLDDVYRFLAHRFVDDLLVMICFGVTKLESTVYVSILVLQECICYCAR